jgi:hypothetical protein
MRVIADPDVAGFVGTTGGRLYVWADHRRCCSGKMTFLHTAMVPPAGIRFQRHEAAGFDLWFDAGTLKLPDELHLEVKGRRKKRVAAYWDGCVFAV